MNVTIIQPPLVQLNTPYPSGAYLKAFFEDVKTSAENETETCVDARGNLIGNVRWLDLSNGLFHKIFSSSGLKKLFLLSEKTALEMAEKSDENTAFQIRRYISLSDAWCFWIDRIVEIACGGKSAREYTHEFVRSPHVPRGNRMENFLYNLGRDVTSDDAKILASLALADLADYITAVFDPDFRLISYAEHLGTSEASFSNVIEGLKSPVLTEFYDALLEEELEIPKQVRNDTNAEHFDKAQGSVRNDTKAELFLVSVPFPGCFEAAVYTAQKIRKMYDKNAIIALGGGFCNTELRNISETRLFDYFDLISYDMGYGSYLHLLDKMKAGNAFDGKPIYKIKYMYDGKIIGDCDTRSPAGTGTQVANDTPAGTGTPVGGVDYAALEEEICRRLVPDYSQVDFSKYPRLADDTNPMHRIWNDGSWLKAYLAHGCYWHRCAFCDTTLEYVNRFHKCNARSLCDGLKTQAEKTGVWGIHFVDEACPPSALVEFGLENCRGKNSTGGISGVPKKLTFWGNIRFEKTFTRDMANFLSYAGLTAVSAGIEIATGDGLEAVNKGTTIENIVKACCAFKEAGILVHSYMIFGYYNQSEQDLINSMETLRQFFKNGLLDSAFWHKFTLTLHSTVYKEWQEGKHPKLKPIVNQPNHSSKAEKTEVRFAENDLRFEGEQKSEKYSEPLNAALDSWMHGENMDVPVAEWFDFKMPSPTIGHKYIKKMIDAYERDRDESYRKEMTERDRFLWLGGKVVVSGSRLIWHFMGEEIECESEKQNSGKLAELLNEIKPENENVLGEEMQKRIREVCAVCGEKVFVILRSAGLCRI